VKPVLTIIAGANGSGKSSFSAVNLKNIAVRVLDADLIAREAGISNMSAGKRLIIA
jgi:predicted ABC-type ATPase